MLLGGLAPRLRGKPVSPMLTTLSSSIVRWLFPPLCVHCRREGNWLCAAARAQLIQESPLTDPLHLPAIDRVIVRGSYDTPAIQSIIQQLKYHYWTSLREILGEVLAPVLPGLADQTSALVPVPLHQRRQRERGFNQSQLIAEALSAPTDWPIASVLQRHRYTTPQASLSGTQRQSNLTGAFRIARGVAKIPNSVILVDDVITTGSTITECASVLRQHGVKRIAAVALAKG